MNFRQAKKHIQLCVALLEIPHHMTNMYNDFGFKPSTTISTNQKS